jgi:signal transduction histidine kinase/CheY-like chemotaxis protein
MGRSTRTLRAWDSPLDTLDSVGGQVAATLLAALEDPAVMVDPGGRVCAWNASAERAFGLAAAGAHGRPLVDLALPNPADPASLVRLPVASEAGGGSLLVWRPARTTVSPDAIQLQKSQAIAWMAGRASHNVANHLGSLLPVADLISSDARLPADLQELAGMLHDKADVSLRLIRSILEIIRLRPDELKIIGLDAIIGTILDLEAGVLINVDLHVALPPDLPEVYGDPARLRQVVLGLTASAIAAMGGADAAGRLRLTASVLGHDPAVVRLAVEDSAPVIPVDQRDGLFDPNPEAGTERARPGADLAVAAWLAALDGGRVTYEPLVDGNRFMLEIPAAATALEASGLAGPRAVPAQAMPTHVVLLCDDEPSILALLARVIGRAGFRTIQASTADAALAHLTQDDVSVVIADQHLTDMKGQDLYVAACEVRPGLAGRFIVMSGDPGAADLLDFSARTGVRVLSKPFDLRDVPALVMALAAG